MCLDFIIIVYFEQFRLRFLKIEILTLISIR